MKKLNSVPATRSQIVKTHTAAARALKLTPRTLRNYRAEGAPGFLTDGRVDLALLRPWIAAMIAERGGAADSKEKKLAEEIRKLRMANDRTEGRLIERAWAAERIQRAAGELNAFRAKSEAEHPMRFAAAAGDVALCRTVIRGIWDEVFSGIQSLSNHFTETK